MHPLGYSTEAAIWKVPRLYGKDVHLLIEHQPEGQGLAGIFSGDGGWWAPCSHCPSALLKPAGATVFWGGGVVVVVFLPAPLATLQCLYHLQGSFYICAWCPGFGGRCPGDVPWLAGSEGQGSLPSCVPWDCNIQKDSSWQITPQDTAQSRPKHLHFFWERSLFACPGALPQCSLWFGPFLGATQVHSGNGGWGMQPLHSPSTWLQLIDILLLLSLLSHVRLRATP